MASVPHYRRSDLTAGIVHFGVGNFHRAHQAVYLDDLFNTGSGHDWALIGAGVRDADEAMRQKLLAQDLLTTVVEQEADASTARVTGVMIDYLKPGDTAAIIARLGDPAIRIVSLTITEGGYYIDPASQKFDPAHSDIAWDAAHIDAPRTAFGLILAGLLRRRDEGTQPFTVMSCDNIPGNGHVTENAVAGLAALIDPALARWVKANVAFPNGMVDRITPATSDRERTLLAENFGIEDNWPVFCESFRQWVLEDNFPTGRPALEKVGVQFVADVAPYEHMKIRILNGGHAAIAYPAGLMDIHFVHEAMENPLVRGFLKKVEQDEIIPIVPPVPDTDLNDYFALCERSLRQSQDRRHHSPPGAGRLQSPAQIHHSLRRRQCCGRTIGDRPRFGLRALVPLLFRHHRFGNRDRTERSELGAPDCPGQVGQGQSAGLAGHGRYLWRSCRQSQLHRRLQPCPDHALVHRHQGDAGALSGGRALTGPPSQIALAAVFVGGDTPFPIL